MADALASGASVRKDVGVQVPPRAPTCSQENARSMDGDESVKALVVVTGLTIAF